MVAGTWFPAPGGSLYKMIVQQRCSVFASMRLLTCLPAPPQTLPCITAPMFQRYFTFDTSLLGKRSQEQAAHLRPDFHHLAPPSHSQLWIDCHNLRCMQESSATLAHSACISVRAVHASRARVRAVHASRARVRAALLQTSAGTKATMCETSPCMRAAHGNRTCAFQQGGERKRKKGMGAQSDPTFNLADPQFHFIQLA